MELLQSHPNYHLEREGVAGEAEELRCGRGTVDHEEEVGTTQLQRLKFFSSVAKIVGRAEKFGKTE